MTREDLTPADGQRDSIHEQASQWFFRLRERPGDPGLLAQFERWKGDDPAKEACYLELLLLWDELERLAPDSDKRAPPAVERAGPPAATRTGHRRGLAALLSLAMLCLLAWLLPARYWLPAADYATGVGETRVVELADGSRLHLNGRSAVTVDFDSAERRLRLLYGEAFFEVARDAARPFRVAARDTTTEAIGTAFNIRITDGRVDTTLTEGRVRVHLPDRAPQPLHAGQRLSWTGDHSVRVSDGPGHYLPAWKQGLLALDRQPLAEVVELLNRHYRPMIRVVDPALWQTPVSGTLPLDDLPTLLAMLERSLAVRHSAIGEQLLLLHR
ncbi:FecR family protein [Marinobacterium arenosum]|uniref:FecR family protein n=1 Tax=Marinobacterium arenosum TaxID=2862496 RepID=UPI001C9885A8|nr:FecR domain-containing protein [Marinobacterium arenosum]MBY4676365.1 FecR domain-containing protein [Marinobacterium arenosum]